MLELLSCISRCFKRRQQKISHSFAEKRKQWLDWLENDNSGIMNHVVTFMHHASMFWVINEAYRMAKPAPREGVMLNGMLMQLLWSTFSRSQMMALRALLDRSEKNHSLYRLLTDIRKNYKLITRENVLKELNIEYDLDVISQRRNVYYSSLPPIRIYYVPNDYDITASKMKHEFLDQICNIKNNNRSRKDVIDITLIDILIGKLMRHDRIRKIANVTIAHNAPYIDLKKLFEEVGLISYGDIVNAQRDLTEIALFLQLLLNNSSTLISGIYSGDPLQYLDQPLVDPAHIIQLSHNWEEYKKEINNAMIWNNTDIVKSMRTKRKLK
jgi:hypothetical protein